jgi:hypothetical protein
MIFLASEYMTNISYGNKAFDGIMSSRWFTGIFITEICPTDLTNSLAISIEPSRRTTATFKKKQKPEIRKWEWEERNIGATIAG